MIVNTITNFQIFPTSLVVVDDWKRHGDSLYFLSMHHDKNWADARKFCSALGAHLVDIDSSEENNFVLDMAKGLVDHFWLALNDRVNEGHFVRSDGSEPKFLNWSYLEPNNQNGEDCAEVRMLNGQWNDLECAERQAFICEKTQGRIVLGKNSNL